MFQIVNNTIIVQASWENQTGKYQFFTKFVTQDLNAQTFMSKEMTFTVDIIYQEKKPCYMTKITALPIRDL